MKKNVKEELVLIVNDRHSDYLHLSEKLATKGLKVSIENERANVVVAAKLLQPALILLDATCLRSEELADVCHQLKSNIDTQNISLICIVSLSQSPHKLKKSDWTDIDYITKPVRLEEIVMRIETRLALRQTDNRIQQEIFNRCQVEALLEQSQQMLREQFGNEIWELMVAKQELLAARREVSTSDRELEEFTHSVSQDLQALMFSLEGLTEQLLGDESDNLSEEQNKYIESLANGDSQIQALVRELSVDSNQKES